MHDLGKKTHEVSHINNITHNRHPTLIFNTNIPNITEIKDFKIHINKL